MHFTPLVKNILLRFDKYFLYDVTANRMNNIKELTQPQRKLLLEIFQKLGNGESAEVLLKHTEFNGLLHNLNSKNMKHDVSNIFGRVIKFFQNLFGRISSAQLILARKTSKQQQVESNAKQIIKDFRSQKFIPETLDFIPIPDNYTMDGHDTIRQNVPPPLRFFQVMTSSYKPLGYYEGRVPSKNTLKWLITKNGEIAGNCRLSESLRSEGSGELRCYRKDAYFYNEDYLKKLLELNVKAFDLQQDAEYKNNIFIGDKVKEGGVAYYVSNHNIEMKGPMLALIHAAFGDSFLEPCYDQIVIPDEPGLRDVIQLRLKFKQHSWVNIQTLLRAYDDVHVVSKLLEKLPPENTYFVQDERLKIRDASCKEYPVLRDEKGKLFTLKDGQLQPYIVD
ncbi:MAG: hypothetical protein H0W50_04505 [Parachlamydiaceae bacterium]|nr:hypothetical protein [Parachlamydiaceae bacterium]